MSNTSRRIVPKGARWYARIHTRGGETTFPLGTDYDRATALYDRIKAAIAGGIDPATIREALHERRDPLAPKPEPKPEPLTVAQVAERWLSERIDATMERRNASMKRSRTERTLLPFLGERSIHTLRRADCHAYAGHLRATRRDLEASSLHHYLRDLRELLNWAAEVEIIAASPWPRSIMPRITKEAPDRLTDKEVRKLIALPEPWGFSMRLALGTGCRYGELCRLERRDLQIGGILVREAKDSEPRLVPVSESLRLEIMRRTGPLFVGRSGRRYSERTSGGFNATIQRQSGVERFHVHMTRHTFACTYLEHGGSLPALQEILGHATVAMTQRYGRLGERAIQTEAAGVFARVSALFYGQSKGQPGKNPGKPDGEQRSAQGAGLM